MRSTLMVVVLVLCGCKSAWERYPESLYAVMREDTREAANAHFNLLVKICDDARVRGIAPPPGVAAELAYYAHRTGQSDKAPSALALELEHYPQSVTFLKVFERHLASVTPMEPSGP